MQKRDEERHENVEGRKEERRKGIVENTEKERQEEGTRKLEERK